ncbi:poly(U)-specific 3'-to-5' RNA exonuclease [Arthrobotrys musiformis]|uniref:U6 snRNA phosphodiesterase n=1 Tax=Arthrobotrys musiformis TaxID=47236 RepID=A0AAV9WB36_9PEZI
MAHQRKPSLGLVDYSDSEDDDDSKPTAAGSSQPAPSTSESLPPLPSKFYDLYTAAPRLTKEDDPEAHGGRHRAIPHIEGNWPTHLYFEWHLTTPELGQVGRLLQVAAEAIGNYEKFHNDEKFKLESFLYSDLGTQLPLHISMSRPIVLRTEERDGFMAELERVVERSGVQSFDVRFTSLEWVPNQDRTRWFWVMRATSPASGQHRQTLLSSLLTACNQVVRSHNQPELYLTDSRGATREGFHVSIGWSLTEPSKGLCEGISAAILNNRPELSDLTMKCGTLKVKIGNAVHAVELRRPF